MRDLMNNIHPVVAVPPQVISDGSSAVSAVVDLQGFESCTFVIATGTLADADATWSVTVKEGDTDTQGAHTDVADVDLIGTEALAGFTFAADVACRKIGYKGGQRYVSIEIDNVVANTGSAPIAVVAILGDPHQSPTSNPPA